METVCKQINCMQYIAESKSNFKIMRIANKKNDGMMW